MNASGAPRRRRIASTCLALLAAAATSSLLAAQTNAAADLEAALRAPTVQAALAHLEAGTPATATLLARIGGILSPSGEERQRAEAVAARMREIGLADVRVDDTPNVVGILRGRSGRALVLIATLDDLATVAEHQRAAGRPPYVEGDRVAGPGTNTSSTTVAMLAAADALVSAGFTPEHDIVFAAVAQEETGLVGMRRLHEEWHERAIAFVDILGDGRSISYGAIGIHWWRIEAHGPAGHSLRGGLPNVNQAIGRAVDRILQLPHPERESESRTVINIAILNSGTVYNHKPETGWFSLDIRSLEAGVIDAIEADVRRILADVERETTIELRMAPFQRTPGGQISGARESRLVRTAEAIARHLGLEPQLGNAGSSNMNVAIAGGSPAIGLGGERGGGRGTPEEWADVPALMRTAKHVMLLAAVLGR